MLDVISRDARVNECKEKILERASYMALEFDKDDIVDIDCGDGNKCVFLKKYFWQPLCDINGNFVLDKNGEPVSIEIPNIWADYPPNMSVKHNTWIESGEFMTEFSVPLPRVHVHFPDLVFLVFADGTFKDGAVIPDAISFRLQQFR